MRLSLKKGKGSKYFFKREQRKRKKQVRISSLKKNRKYNRKIKLLKLKHDPSYEFRKLRQEVRKKLYKKAKYKESAIEIIIEDEFGLENEIKNFIDKTQEFMGKKAKEFYFDFSNCTKIWPSGITLLCSLAQMVEITSMPGKMPRLASSYSNYDKVNSYLTHCGFYDYVERFKDETPSYYSEDEIVKIRRETEPANLYKREVEIISLLKKFSGFSEDELEEFNDVVLTEILNNVSEHGITYRDTGWWTLSQYHKTSGIISICIADNGIGFKNNLSTGPQRLDILKKINEKELNDGNFIKLAIEENVSGAITASQKSRKYLIRSCYERGSRRGHGLKRVINTCKKLGIRIVILSQNGYIEISRNGSIKTFGTKFKRVFAGTLYHLTIYND